MEINNENEQYVLLENKLADIYREYEKYLCVITSGDRTSQAFKDAVIKVQALEEIIFLKKTRDNLNSKISETLELLESRDGDIRKLAEEELRFLIDKKTQVDENLRNLLFPEKTENLKNAIVEIRAGIGGEEAGLFARDLFRMYSRFCEKKGYGIEVLSTHQSAGGFKEIIFLVKGRGAYGDLRYEGGVHRVQRVPDTENYGRIHTSAATVAVFPETEETELRIAPDEIKIDTFRSSGAGGQSVNKTSSAVRVTHIPTGMVISCQDERSQMQNKVKAMKILRAKLQELYESEKKSKIDSERRESVRTGERSEKIRTYNFPQNRLTDHRIDSTLYNLDRIMDGDMDDLLKLLKHKLQ